VAKALLVPLSHLLLEDDLKPQVVRRQDRNVIHVDNGGLRASILSPLPSRTLELVLLELPPGKASWTKLRFHEGQECHLIIRGRVRASYGEESFLLEEGDSIFWDGTAPHRMENVGIEEAHILIALAPPAFLPLEPSEEAKGGDSQPS
jgi:mannose-6-phosphate isomerase-like protein (cupin superfamily)